MTGLGFALPWMLCWLPLALMPLLLARLALRRPRLVRWGPSDLLAAAARTSHLTRGGLPWPFVILRGLVLACATAAAALPFVTSPAGHGGKRPAEDDGLVVFLRDTQSAEDRAAPQDSIRAIRSAMESLAASATPPRRTGSSTGGSAAPERVEFAVGDLSRLSSTRRTLLILGDQSPPAPTDTHRLASAVEAGACLLVCLGPRALGDEAGRRRLSAWLEEFVGITVDGRVALPDDGIELIDDLTGGGADQAASGNGRTFTLLPGPCVKALAGLGGAGAVTVLARSAAAGRPLLVEARHGRGAVCLSALPLSLPPLAADASADEWSDLAAWPAFVPLVDRLVARLMTAAAVSPANRSPAGDSATVPLTPIVLAMAIACLLADWWLSWPASGSRSSASLSAVESIGRMAALAVLATMAVAWSTRPRDTSRADKGERLRPIALVIDTSPSMAGPNGPATPVADQTTSRLAVAMAALTASSSLGSPLDRIGRDRPVTAFTAAGTLTALGGYPREVTTDGLRGLAAVTAGPRASRIGDAIVDLITGGDGDDPAGRSVAPAAVIVVSDGAITAGASWATAAAVAAGRRVPLFTIPTDAAGGSSADDSLPPGFRITAVVPPRLCHVAEPFTIDISAEATTASGPLEARLAAGPGEPLLASAVLDSSPAADGMTQRFRGRLTVPPRSLGATGARLESPVLSVGRPDAAGPRAAEAVTTCSLAVTDDPVRVLMIDASPRFEWRFLERLLSRDPTFAVETCMLDPPTAGRMPAVPLPQTIDDWNRFDVVVLGDVAASEATADRTGSWRSLREAAAADGIGIAWLPGGRWWRDPDPALDWLPAVPGGAGSTSMRHRLLTTTGGRTGGWQPFVAAWEAAGIPGATASPAEVFAVLRPSSLRPTARVIATAAPPDAPAGKAVPAVIIDRLGSATILGHLCETWRWQRQDDRPYREYWRRSILELSAAHQLGRSLTATIAVSPSAPEEGDVVRIYIVPTRAGAGFDGWHLEVSSRASADQDAGATRRLDLPAAGLGGTTSVAIEGLSAGRHSVRLLPRQAEPRAETVTHDILIAKPPVEIPGGPPATTVLGAAARASGGATVTMAALATLPEKIAAALALSSADANAALRGGIGGSWHWPASPVLANLLVLSLAIAGAAAWWQPRDLHSGGAAR